MISEFDGIRLKLKPEGVPVEIEVDGRLWLLQLGIDVNAYFFDMVILAVFAVGFTVISGILLQLFVKEKR